MDTKVAKKSIQKHKKSMKMKFSTQCNPFQDLFRVLFTEKRVHSGSKKIATNFVGIVKIVSFNRCFL